MRKGLGLRLEGMIGYQAKDDPFIVEYRKIIGKIKEKLDKGYYDFEVNRDPLKDEVQNLINDRFKMNIDLVTDGAVAAIIPFFANDANVLMREFFRQDKWLASETEFMQSKPSLKGYVDLDNVTFGGDYTKAKSTLYMNYNLLLRGVLSGGYNMKYDQVIAINLHEIGHAFLPLAFANRLDRSNIVFEEARRELIKPGANKREILSKTFEKLDKSMSPALVNDLCSEDPNVLTKAMIKLMGERALCHQVNAKYSNTNFEMMADNFAARFGLGESLVTALEKMTPGGAKYGDLVRAVQETLAIVSHLMRLFTIVKIANKMPTAVGKVVMFMMNFIFYGIGSAIFFYVLVRMSGESGRNYTYDDLVIRYSRIRQQMINDVKGGKLTKADARKVIESVDFIGNLIKEGKNWRTPLDFLFNTLNPDDRRAKDSITRQQAMESLINNDLFIASLKLQQLAH